MPVPERANITLSARTYNGSIRSSFTLPGDAGEWRGKRVSLTLGNGSAHVELESFGGTIALRRPGEARPETERRRRERSDGDKDREKGKDDWHVDLGDFDVDWTIAEARGSGARGHARGARRGARGHSADHRRGNGRNAASDAASDASRNLPCAEAAQALIYNSRRSRPSRREHPNRHAPHCVRHR